jgi:two-component system, NtrC family, nitrogen regulation response regulator NtrX
MHPPEVSPGALAVMERYDWPGNVRELANICERLAILYGGGVVGAGDVDELLPRDRPDTSSLADRLEAFERRQIEAALAAARGSVAEAARSLQTDRANLYRRMKRLGLER